MARSPEGIFTVNGGSSSIKFAYFEVGDPPRRVFAGRLERIGRPAALLKVEGAAPGDTFERTVEARDHAEAVNALMAWIRARRPALALAGIGHRVVHGGARYARPERVDAALMDELRKLSPFDPDHLPEEILLTQAFHEHFPGLPQVACFDTAFHHDLPAVSRLFAIPRRYEARGVRRYGFHGLSYAFMLEEWERREGPRAAQGRLVLAHLGSGASLAAVRGGKSVDTTMGFSPAAGVPMGTRSGDIDPGLAWYLLKTEGLDPRAFHEMINHESGLLGLSGSSPDMRDLIDREDDDPRAAEAVALFCYQVKKCVGAYAAALGGLDGLAFAGGIGENSPPVRARICAGLEFLGLRLDPALNAADAPVISAEGSAVKARVIRTDEELMIARSTMKVLELNPRKEE